MKTLKIITAVCVIALIVAIVFGVIYSQDKKTYASKTESSKLSNGQRGNVDMEDKDDGIEVSKTSGYEVGDEAEDFSLMNVDNSYVSLSSYPDAKGYVIIFTCNHCPYSKRYEDRIIAIDKKFKRKGYPVIAINPNNPKTYPADSFEMMKVRSRDKGFTFPYLFDEGQKVYPIYGATKTPHVFLLNKESGKNIVRYIGAIDDNYQDVNAVKNHFLENAINALLEHREINPVRTAAIGCTVKK